MNDRQLAEFLADWRAELQAENDAAIAKMQQEEQQQNEEKK
jgi:hypothetical protein